MTEENAVVSRDEWLAARKKLLAREKDFTRARDELNAQRRALPWVRVDKRYVFQTDAGPKSLAELFGDKSQLVVYHLMFAPDWEKACKSCSFWADNFNGIDLHLAARDIQFLAISRAPLPKLKAFARRMGWTFPWVSSHETDFNYDFEVSFTPEAIESGRASYNFGTPPNKNTDWPGINVFYKDASGVVYNTYSSYGRGIEMVNAAYQWMDLVPKGRDEDKLKFTMEWVRLHDEYAR
jgi:predicted dithiol-disulfide oxidoreductase (DUF899 family)